MAQLANHLLVEATSGPGRVAPIERHRFTIGQAALTNLKYLIGNATRLIEYVEWCRAGRVQAGEGFAILLTAGHGIDAPRLLVDLVVHVHGAATARIEDVPVLSQL